MHESECLVVNVFNYHKGVDIIVTRCFRKKNLPIDLGKM